MADKSDKAQKKEKTEESNEKKSLVSRLLPWIVMVVVVGLCAGAGLGLGKILAGTDDKKDAAQEGTEQGDNENIKINLDTGSGKLWYFDLEPPVVANLNEPGVTRYVSASLTLQMGSSDEKEVRAYLEEKTPILRNWLYIFLSSLSLKDIQGDKNLKNIQSQICEGFNEELFPESKPQIKQILIREFPAQ